MLVHIFVYVYISTCTYACNYILLAHIFPEMLYIFSFPNVCLQVIRIHSLKQFVRVPSIGTEFVELRQWLGFLKLEASCTTQGF